MSTLATSLHPRFQNSSRSRSTRPRRTWKTFPNVALDVLAERGDRCHRPHLGDGQLERLASVERRLQGVDVDLQSLGRESETVELGLQRLGPRAVARSCPASSRFGEEEERLAERALQRVIQSARVQPTKRRMSERRPWP